MTIQQLSQELGIGIDTLRIWERRYGFPIPGRDARGHRSYSAQQVEELRVVKQLQSFGQRPGKIFALSAVERRQFLDELLIENIPDDSTLQKLIDELSVEEIAREIAARRKKLDLTEYIQQFVLPLLQLLDHDWSSGTLTIAREHLISDQLEAQLKKELSRDAEPGKPKILFLTLSGERHKLGLLLAALLFQHAGVCCLWLNEELPLSEIPGLAAELGVAGVALSFSTHYPQRQAKNDLASLRRLLDPQIRLIAGGQAVSRMSGLPNLLICTDLEQIPQLVCRHFSNPQKEE